MWVSNGNAATRMQIDDQAFWYRKIRNAETREIINENGDVVATFSGNGKDGWTVANELFTHRTAYMAAESAIAKYLVSRVKEEPAPMPEQTSNPLTPEQERTAAWVRCKMHGCTASAVYGGLCMTHKDWEQGSCNDCGQVFPIDELIGVWDGPGGYNLCEFCMAKHPARAATSDEIKLYLPELWY